MKPGVLINRFSGAARFLLAFIMLAFMAEKSHTAAELELYFESAKNQCWTAGL